MKLFLANGVLSLYTYYFILVISGGSVAALDNSSDTSEEVISVPECPYEKGEDGNYICVEPKSGGAIPKLMQCANKMRAEFGSICKNKPSKETLAKIKAQCVDVCIMPCAPSDMSGLMMECVKLEDISDPDMLSMDVFCDEKRQKETKQCGTRLFKEKKQQLMGMFNKKIHVLCKLCTTFHSCLKRIISEAPTKN